METTTKNSWQKKLFKIYNKKNQRINISPNSARTKILSNKIKNFLKIYTSKNLKANC